MTKAFTILSLVAGGISLGSCAAGPAGPYGAIGYTNAGPVSLADCPQKRYVDPPNIDKPCERVKGSPYGE